MTHASLEAQETLPEIGRLETNPHGAEISRDLVHHKRTVAEMIAMAVIVILITPVIRTERTAPIRAAIAVTTGTWIEAPPTSETLPPSTDLLGTSSMAG